MPDRTTCRACNGMGRVHEDLTDRDRPVYAALSGADLSEPHPWRVVPCRRCKGLEREPADDEVILTTTEFGALPEYSASFPTGTTLGKQWKRNRNADRGAPGTMPTLIVRDPDWWRGEYVDCDEAGMVGLAWHRITIHDSPIRVGDVCPTCNGSGRERRGSGQPGVYGAYMTKCFDCNGTGQVQRPLAERLAALRDEKQPGDDDA